jgi:hypothetical protein
MLERDTVKVRFPWVAFLSQPIAHPTATLILNPFKFKNLYHRWMLEMCFLQETAIKRSQKSGVRSQK